MESQLQEEVEAKRFFFPRTGKMTECDPLKREKLTMQKKGRKNNTCYIDGLEQAQGEYHAKVKDFATNESMDSSSAHELGRQATWDRCWHWVNIVEVSSAASKPGNKDTSYE